MIHERIIFTRQEPRFSKYETWLLMNRSSLFRYSEHGITARRDEVILTTLSKNKQYKFAIRCMANRLAASHQPLVLHSGDMPQKHLNHFRGDTCSLLLELCDFFRCLLLKTLDICTRVTATLCNLPLKFSLHLGTVFSYFPLSLLFCLPKPCRFCCQTNKKSLTSQVILKGRKFTLFFF